MSEKAKSAGELLKEQLFYENKNGFSTLTEDQIQAAYDFCEPYKSYLDIGKTEREVVIHSIALAKAEGFTEFEYGTAYKAGDKLYVNNRGKSLILFIIGTSAVDSGVNIAAAHIDSPRIDLKQNPLYEDNSIAYFKTHYYGGIKKYQWTTIPLALHGVVVRKDGTTVDICVGEDESDPIFCISDLLPHLGKDQMVKSLSTAFTGEMLNILIGTRQYEDKKLSERTKLYIMKLLNEKYGIIEADFQSAELSIVPAFKARDLGFDRSLIAAYGHDDRVCAYPSLKALFDIAQPEKTSFALLADKEEVGSDGNTGMQSDIFRHIVEDLANSQNVNPYKAFQNSRCLSSDVNAAFDPGYPEVFERTNQSFLNAGVVLTKYTGSRGKSDTSDASAEYVALCRRIFDDAGVLWQTSELGKVDQGGGGTVAKYIANLNIDVVDLGVPVLSMHAPYEAVSKIDVHQTYLAIKAFYEKA